MGRAWLLGTRQPEEWVQDGQTWGRKRPLRGALRRQRLVIRGADHPEEWMGKHDLKGVKLVRVSAWPPHGLRRSRVHRGQMTTAATPRLVHGGNNSETGWHPDRGLLEE